MINTEIITIGDEILIGQVVDTNSAWLAHNLNLLGINVKQISSVSDDEEHIIEALNEAGKRADIILITGGLGPTKDDITKQTLCKYFNSKPVFNKAAYENIERLFIPRNYTITELNRGQAELPENCIPLHNEFGTAYGMWFEKDKKIFVSMPGVPYEMQAMAANILFPMLKEKFKFPAIVHKTIITQGAGESYIAELIEEWENALPKHLKLAYLPAPGIVRLRLTGRGEDKAVTEKEVADEIKKLEVLLTEYIVALDDETLEEVIGKLLAEKKQTLATAESCTGGYIAHLITSVAGSSAYYKGSVIAYADEVKVRELNVKAEDIEKHGAVSMQVAEQMAAGARKKLKVDYAVGVTGIAGPGGGSEEKPAGTAWIAVASGKGVVSKKFMFGDNRERNIRKSALAALNMLRKEILND